MVCLLHSICPCLIISTYEKFFFSSSWCSFLLPYPFSSLLISIPSPSSLYSSLLSSPAYPPSCFLLILAPVLLLFSSPFSSFILIISPTFSTIASSHLLFLFFSPPPLFSFSPLHFSLLSPLFSSLLFSSFLLFHPFTTSFTHRFSSLLFSSPTFTMSIHFFSSNAPLDLFPYWGPEFSRTYDLCDLECTTILFSFTGHHVSTTRLVMSYCISFPYIFLFFLEVIALYWLKHFVHAHCSIWSLPTSETYRDRESRRENEICWKLLYALLV